MRAVNLIPADQRAGAGGLAGRSGGAALIALGLIAGLAVLALLYGRAQHNISSGRSELATVNGELTAARAQVGRLTQYTSFIAMADQRAQEISQLVSSRFDWSHAFNELGRVLPRTATLTSLHGQVGAGTGSGSSSPAASGAGAAGAASVSSSTPPGSTTTFQLAGCATTQSEVANTLQRLRLMDGAAEVTLQSSTKSGRGAGGAGQASASSGPCPAGSPTFSATVTFAPLPTPPPAPSAAAIVPMPVSAPSKHAGPRRVTVSTKPRGSR